MNIVGQSEIGKIKNILLKHPKNAYLNQGNIDYQWKKLNYTQPPDYNKALSEYDKFVELIKSEAEGIYYLPKHDKTALDSIYIRDPVVITKKGAILCNMGKDTRRGEPAACAEYLKTIGVPIFGEISGSGRLEGGDIVWLDEKTVAVGEGYRTNAEGIRQLKELVSNLVEDFVVVPLPHWKGPGDVLHLMSMISLIDYDLAVVYSRQMPVAFRQYLIDRGMKLIEVDDLEYDSMACNILTMSPRKCIMLSGNEWTKKKLENEGVVVYEYDGFEISRKGAGGPTCLTRPILREG